MENIKLRGHHLRSLYDYYVKKISLQKLKEHFTSRYDKELATRVIYTILSIKNPKTKIKFIDKPDYICAKCSRYDKRCDEEFGSEDDRKCLEVYDFELNEIYSSKEILKRFKSNSGLRMFYPEEYFIINKEEKMVTDYDVANAWLGVED